MLKIIKQYHDKDVEHIKCSWYVIALEKREKNNSNLADYDKDR